MGNIHNLDDLFDIHNMNDNSDSTIHEMNTDSSGRLQLLITVATFV